MKRLAMIALLASAPALAQDEGPSFDCAAAQTATEKTLCDDANRDLAAQDRALQRLYSRLKMEGGHDDLLAGQGAWRKSRDKCASNYDCIYKSQMGRLGELAKALGDEKGVTAGYSYDNGDDKGGGRIWVVREPEGTLTGQLVTVTGPSAHVCDLSFTNAEPIGDAWLYTGSPDESDGDDKLCRVLFRPEKASLRLDSIACRYWCGANGWFDETYGRMK